MAETAVQPLKDGGHDGRRNNCDTDVLEIKKSRSVCTVITLAPCDGIVRVTTLTMLGVVINEQLTAADHVSSLLKICSRLVYALRVLRNHGIPAASMSDVFSATVLAKLMYCAPAWAGFTSAADRARLDAFLRWCRRLDTVTKKHQR